jgi:hypothetical protein
MAEITANTAATPAASTEPAAAPATAATTPASTPTPVTTAPKAEDIATAFLSALENRTQRVERSVAKSFSEQYGLSEQEIGTILAQAKAQKDAQLPAAAIAEINKQTERANNKLIAAEVKALGADMGLVDLDTALLLMKRDGVQVDDTGNVTGVKEALEALQQEKAFLFRPATAGQQAQPQNPQGATVATGASLAGTKAYASKAEIMKIKDPELRQKAIAENWALFNS